ncbi:MAG TPA: hypothetical protein VFC42_07875 [Methylomirabilota bacterium]|jgi:DNA-binding IclR family transcriptional regulator|nr:hypothetical protein [Methylomirabilota bacterium]
MDGAEGLLEAAGMRHPCDLDLLLFFDAHPHGLLTAEKLAALVGYDAQQVGRSLEWLVTKGLLSRSLNPNHPHVARMYRLRPEAGEDWLAPLLRLGSTRAGRLMLIRRVRERAEERNGQALGVEPAPPAQGGR